jgi:hypothetical protein
MEEEYVLATDPEFKDLLAQIESGKSIGELSVALNKINLQPKVSK